MKIVGKFLVNPSIEYAGKKYEIYVFDGDVLSKEESYRKKIYEAYNKIENEFNINSIPEFQDSMRDYFDLLLGKGSFDKIFEDSSRNIFNLTEVFEKITEALNTYGESVINEFINQ